MSLFPEPYRPEDLTGYLDGLSLDRVKVTAKALENTQMALEIAVSAIEAVKAEAIKQAREACAKFVETNRWHPGGASGSVNPDRIAKAIRELDIEGAL